MFGQLEESIRALEEFMPRAADILVIGKNLVSHDDSSLCC